MKLAKRKTEYRYHVVYYGDGTKGSLKIAKGTLASPAFWEAVEDAEARRSAYCGHHHGRTDPGEMVTRFQCRDCYAERLRGFSNYRPPSERQSMASICPRAERHPIGAYRDDPDEHRRAFDRYRHEDAARAARRAEAQRAWAEIESTEIPHIATDVEHEPESDPYAMYSPETRDRLNALRAQLMNGD